MTQSWFRMNAAGRVDGLAQSSRSDAEMNLAPGQYLLPHDPAVNPKTDIYDKKRQKWQRDKTLLPRPEDDYRFMRGTGYPSAEEQVGVLMKIMAALLSGEPVSAEVKSEFAAIADKIAAIKAAHPKSPAT